MNPDFLSWWRNGRIVALGAFAALAPTLLHGQTLPDPTGPADNITAGDQFGAAVNGEGDIQTWGLNDDGQLGLGQTDSPQARPVTVPSSFSYDAVEAGTNFMFAISADGDLAAWGNNDFGQLGIGGQTLAQPLESVSSPRTVSFPGSAQQEVRIVRVAAGARHALAIDQNGRLYAWGDNASGALGLGTDFDPQPEFPGDTIVEAPRRVGTDTWVAIAAARTTADQGGAGQSYSLGIKTDGSLWVWGSGAEVLNGNGSPGAIPLSYSPVPYPGSSGQIWADVRLGNVHAIGLTADGRLFGWGQSPVGQTGLGSGGGGFGVSATFPQQIGGKSDWALIGTGSYQSYAVDANGDLFAWGLNSSEQLGQPVIFDPNSVTITNRTLFSPTQIDSAVMVTAVDGGRDDINSGPMLSDSRELTGFTVFQRPVDGGATGIFTIGGNLNGQAAIGQLTFIPSSEPQRTTADGLAISISAPEVATDDIGVNSTIAVSATVTNTGPVNVPSDYIVEIFLLGRNDTDLTEEDPIASVTVTDPLSVGSNREINFPEIAIGNPPEVELSLVSRVRLDGNSPENIAENTIARTDVTIRRPSFKLENLDFGGGTRVEPDAGGNAVFEAISFELTNDTVGVLPEGEPVSVEVFLLGDLSFDPAVNLNLPETAVNVTDDAAFSAPAGFIPPSYTGGLNSVNATAAQMPPPTTVPFVIDTLTLDHGFSEGQEDYQLVFVVNRDQSVAEQTGVTEQNFLVQRIAIVPTNPVGPALNFGQADPIGGVNPGGINDWREVTDTEALNNNALQSPPIPPPNPPISPNDPDYPEVLFEKRNGEFKEFSLDVFGPTVINAPWLIDGGDDDGVFDVLMYELKDANDDPVLGADGEPFMRTLTGFNPTYNANLIVVDPDSSLYDETGATAPYPWKITWTYIQNSDSDAAFARVDLETANFLPNPDSAQFVGVDDSEAPFSILDPDQPAQSAQAGRQVGQGMQPGDIAVLNLNVNLTRNSLVKFWWRTEGDAGQDVLTFSVDGVVQGLPTADFDETPEPAALSGDSGWRQVAFPVESGPHTLRWTFAINSDNIDALARIDGLQILDPAPAGNQINRDTPPPDRPLPPDYSYADIPPSNVNMAIETVVAAPGTYILDDSNGTGRLPISVVATNIGADFEATPEWDPSDLEIHLSLDQNFGNDDDINIGNFGQVEVLTSGNQVIFEADLNLPFNTPAGNYFILVRFNGSFESGEFSFANNSVTAGPGFVIVRAPNLVIQSKRTFSPTYPYRPEYASYIRYDIANTGLGTITESQDFDIRLDLRAVPRLNPVLDASIPIRSYNEIPQSLFLPEASGQFPEGSSSEVTHFVDLPSLRDLLVAVGSVPAETPEDDATVFSNQFDINEFLYYFEVTVDSRDDIQESSETNRFLIFTPRDNSGSDQGALFFSIVPVNSFFIDSQGLAAFTEAENYGIYTGKAAFSEFTISDDNPLTNPNANTDGDDLSNLFEYALATNPSAATELFNRARRNGTTKLDIPGFPNDSNFMTLTFDFNVRMTDLNLLVQASDDPLVGYETIVTIDPPFLETSGPRSLTGFGGLVSNPRVLSVEGNVTDVQSVYSARVTIRDVVPFGNDTDGRFMRIVAEPEFNTPPQEPTDLSAGRTATGSGVVVTWNGVAQDLGAGINAAFQIERSTQSNANYRLIGTTTETDNNNDAQFIDRTVESNRTYFYRVRTVGVAGVTDYAVNPQTGNRFVSVTITTN